MTICSARRHATSSLSSVTASRVLIDLQPDRHAAFVFRFHTETKLGSDGALIELRAAEPRFEDNAQFTHKSCLFLRAKSGFFSMILENK